MLESSPSVQSLLTGSRTPYSSITGLSLGLIMKSLVGVPSLENTMYISLCIQVPYKSKQKKKNGTKKRRHVEIKREKIAS